MPTASSIRRVPRSVVALFFGSWLVLGGLLFADYGVSWDEHTDRANGLVSLRYVASLVAPGWAARQPLLQAAPDIKDYLDNDHGVLLEVPLALFDVLRGDCSDPRPYYLLRHALVFLLSLGGGWALFRLGALRFRDERLGLLAAGLLLLSPRLFAESCYNAKDVTFMAAFTLGAYTLARLLAHPTGRRALVHGLVTAAATDIRVLGVLLGPLTLGLLGLRWWATTAPPVRRELVRAGLGYGLVMAAGVIVGWPYLWQNPVRHLAIALLSMGHFRWGGPILYAGHIISATKVPWHYIPVWLSITTPVAYQVAALLGVGIAAAGLLRRARWRTPAGHLDLLLLAWLGLPLALVIGLHSVLYDGWRHLYFVYPALLLLAVRGGLAVVRLARRGPGWHRLALGLGLLAAAEAVGTAVRMARMHPFEQTYFSYLPRPLAERLFERDYWGLAYRQGLEYLIRQQPTGPVLLQAVENQPLENNLIWLPLADQRRVVPTAHARPRYVLTTYRHTPAPASDSLGREVYAIRADGVKILSVFRRE
ncbi:MAG: hypothetical protein ACRYFX_18440 [Janthinobacterium lividum]